MSESPITETGNAETMLRAAREWLHTLCVAFEVDPGETTIKATRKSNEEVIAENSLEDLLDAMDFHLGDEPFVNDCRD